MDTNYIITQREIVKHIKTYTVYPFADTIGSVPMHPITGYISSTDNGMTIIKDLNDAIICVITGNYCIVEYRE